MNRPLSSKTHTVIGLIIGGALLVAPYLFTFGDIASATLSAQLIGVLVLLSELISTSPYSPLKIVPMRVHTIVDIVIGAFIAISPWLFDFAQYSANVWLPHLVVGLAIIGYALLTETVDEHLPHLSAHA